MKGFPMEKFNDEEKEIDFEEKEKELSHADDDFDLLPDGPESDKKVDMNDIIAKGKNGDLSLADLEEAMDEYDFDADKLYDTLESNGISIPMDIPQSEMAEIENEVEKFGTPESMERILEQEGLAIADPVRMYLKEIGNVPWTRRQHREALRRQGNVLPRSDPGGQPRTYEGCREVRL